MSDLDRLVARAEAYAKATGFALGTVSVRILNDGKALGEIKRGGRSMTLRTLEKASARLAELEKALDAAAATERAS